MGSEVDNKSKAAQGDGSDEDTAATGSETIQPYFFAAQADQPSWIADLIDADPFARDEPMLFPYYEPTGFSFRGDGASTIVSSTRSNLTTIRSTAASEAAESRHKLQEKLKGLPIGSLLEKLQKEQLLKARPRPLHRVFEKARSNSGREAAGDEALVRLKAELSKYQREWEDKPEESETSINETMKKIATLAMEGSVPSGSLQKAKEPYTSEHGSRSRPYAKMAAFGFDLIVAEAVMKEVKEDMQDFGLESACLAAACIQLGNILSDKAENKDAMDQYFEGLDIQQKNYGNGHACVAETFCNMGRTLLNQGSMDQAKDCLEEAENIMKECRKEALESELLADILYLRALPELLTVEGREVSEKDAVQLMEKSLGIYKHHGNMVRLLQATMGLADLHCRQEEYEKAENLFEDCLQLVKNQFDLIDQRSWISRIHVAMGDTFSQSDRHEQVISCFQEAVSMNQLPDLDSIRLRSEALAALGDYSLKLGEEDIAMDYFQQVPIHQMTKELKQHIDVKCSILQFRTGNVQAAQATLGNLCSSEHQYELDQKTFIVSLLSLGACHFVSGNNREAKRCYKDALHIARNFIPSERDTKLEKALKNSIDKTSQFTLGSVLDTVKQRLNPASSLSKKSPRNKS